MRTLAAFTAASALVSHLVAATAWAQYTTYPTRPQTQPQSAPTTATPPLSTSPSRTTTSPSTVPGTATTAPPAPPPGPVPPLFEQPMRPGGPTPPGGRSTTTTPPPQQQPPLAKPVPPPSGAVPFDYSINLATDVFGANLFTGAFAASRVSIFNPDHVISIGDQLQVRLWGAFQFEAVLTVDPQGNIFLPEVGPVGVAGVQNKDLPAVLEKSIRRVFRANVYSYITLAAAQPVRVFVTGYVFRPGMYEGTSTDSILRYLDQAGGIDPERGSFLDVRVMRGSQVRGEFNLYDFLLGGRLPGVQLGDGDVILVQPRKSVFRVLGFAENPKRFEFTGTAIDVTQLVTLARPLPVATHVRVHRITGTVRNTEYYSLAEAKAVRLDNGDEVEFTSDQRPGTIAVRVEGEHLSPQEYVLPYGSRLGDLVKRIEFTERSDSAHLQLFRFSVRERQREHLQASLRTLETAVLTARSGTGEEAHLRAQEAALMLQWVERARTLEPLGQVVIAQSEKRDDLLLENGDIVRVPVKNGLVLVHGEVLFPNAVAHDDRYNI
jgi:protein involved in polysaccharide export with SLBB domain